MKLIAVMDEKRGIGKDGGLLCHLPSDLKYFKKITLGHDVIMGRATLESFPGGKPLPGRRNIVLSKTLNRDDVLIVRDVKELMSIEGIEDAFVIGGGQVYAQLLPYCDTAYITQLEGDFGAQVFMPDILAAGFEKTASSDINEENGVKFTFDVYKNRGLSGAIQLV